MPSASGPSGSGSRHRGHADPSHSPPSSRRPAGRGYGHRVLIASLFLPDTITFHQYDESIIASPHDQCSAPPSPPIEADDNSLSVHELGKRLAGVSAAFKANENSHSPSNLEPGGAADRKDPSPLKSQSQSGNDSKNHNRRPSASTGKDSAALSATGSGLTSGQNTGSVNMSQLMAEASKPPDRAGMSRTSSNLGLGNPTPLSSVADHGRDAERMNGTRPSTAGATKPTFHRGHSQPQSIIATSPQTMSHDSPSAGGRATTGASTSTANSSLLQVPSASTPASSVPSNTTAGQRRLADGTGTRTPGGAVAGKTGTLVPLSIIEDLQARQSQYSNVQMSTPGDAERHHPFGGGAVTPFRGSQTPGLAPKTPGAPSGAQTPAALNKGYLNALSMRPAPPAPLLSMTKAREGASPNLSVPKETGTGSTSPRPQSTTPRFHPSSQGAVASVHFNDHGRGAGPVKGAPPSPKVTEEAVPPHLKKSTHFNDGEKGDYFGDGVRSSTPSTTNAGSPTRERERERERERLPWSSQRHHRGPTSAAASSLSNRSASRHRRATRMHSLMGRKAMRRSSADTLSTFAEEGGEDGSPEYGLFGPEDLPPYDFVSNPSSNGGLVNAIASLADQRKLRGPGGGKVFVGTPGFNRDEKWLTSRHRRSIGSRFREEKSASPVWVKEATFRGAYYNFCKGILWPTFHYTLPSDQALEGEHEAFECYRDLNAAFARKIAEEWKEGDIVLINDYHLLLVPQMLRELVPSATIGLFVHIAFPSSELFRCLAMRETLLRGMLGADLVGFQTHNFCRHFRQTVSRILQLEATPKGVQTETVFTTVSPFPIGIDPRNLNAKRADPEVEEWVAKLTERYEGKKVIVGRDKLDWIRGVRQKLLAFEVFLNEHPEWVGKVVLIQVALATSEENGEAGEANNVVSRINSKFSSLTYQPVVFLHVQDITFSQYLALLTVADGFMANSLREGMNLTTHEYIICQEEKQSPLILSEFTGTYSALRACIGINPWNTKQVAHAIHKALTMPQEEQRARWADLHRTVVTQTALQWITSLLSRLERAHIEQQRRDNAFIPELEIGQLVSEWRASKTRLLLLDLEGTLLGESILLLREPSDFEIPDSLIQTIGELSEDGKNAIYIISSLSSSYLDRIAERLPQLGLIAEDGCAVRHPGRSEWMSLIAGLNNAWKDSVIEILKYFQDRTPGSFLHDRGATLFFSTGEYDDDSENGAIRHDSKMYCSLFSDDALSHSTSSGPQRSQESQWARRQLAEINNLVYDSLGERYSLRIIPRGTTLTVMPKNVSRASAAQHIVQLQAMGYLSRMAPVSSYSASDNASKHGLRDAVLTPEVELDGFDPASGTTTPSNNKSNGGNRPWEVRRSFNLTGPSSSSISSVLSGSEQQKQGTDASREAPVVSSPHEQPWSAPASASAAARGMSRSRDSSSTSLLSPSSLLSAGPMGNFDFALYMGQDERLMSYIASLDLPFAPLTVTTANIDLRGSEAGFSCPDQGVEEALRELVAFRKRDIRWGAPASVDI